MTIEALIRTGEGPTIEFKERLTPPQVLAKIISAFSNTAGGLIIIGVRDPDFIVGVNPEKFNKLYHQATQRITGPWQTSHETIVIDRKTVGVIHVRKAISPVGSSEGYFIRAGCSTQALMPEELGRLFTKEASVNRAIEFLSQTVSKQTEEIGKLRKSFEKANSWKRKFFYALLGALATGIAKLVLAALRIILGS